MEHAVQVYVENDIEKGIALLRKKIAKDGVQKENRIRSACVTKRERRRVKDRLAEARRKKHERRLKAWTGNR